MLLRVSSPGLRFSCAFLAALPLACASAAHAAAAVTPPPALPDYAGLYHFDTVAGQPSAGLLNTTDGDTGHANPIAYRAPAAIVSFGETEFIADTGNGVLRQVSGSSVDYALHRYHLTGDTSHSLPGTFFYAAPSGLALGPDRALYFSEAGGHRIHRYVLPTDFAPGRLTVFAGSGKSGHTNATGRSARFHSPGALAIDQNGNVFVADTGNHVIRKISSSGRVTTFAGAPGTPGHADDKGSRARFHSPAGLALDPAGNLYVSDTGNHVIRVILPSGHVTTLAGLAGDPAWQNGPGAEARFSSPRGLRVRADGLIVADTGNHALRFVTLRGVVSTLAGTPTLAGNADGPADSASFSSPSDLTIRPDGSLRIVDTGNHRLRDLSLDGQVTTHSGLPGGPGSADGQGSATRLDHPTALAPSTDALFLADTGNQALRRLSWADSTLTTVATLPLHADAGLAASSAGDILYVTDLALHTLRAVTTTDGVIGELPVTPALQTPRGIAVAPDGRLYLAEATRHTIRRYDPATGAFDTFAGQPGLSGALDGPAATATLRTPWALAFGPGDTLYVLERDSRSLRRIAPDGTVSTRHLDLGQHLIEPSTLTVDRDGNVFIADSRNRLFLLPANGSLGILAGENLRPGSEDKWLLRYENNQPVLAARFDHPRGLAIGPDDFLYIADTGNSTLRRGRPPMYNLTGPDIRVDTTGRDTYIAAPSPTRVVVKDLPSSVLFGVATGIQHLLRAYSFHPTSPLQPGAYPCTLRAELHDYVRARPVVLHVFPNNQQVTLSPPYFTYDGTPKAPVITVGDGMTVTEVLYNGSTTPPTERGTHLLRVTYSLNGAVATQTVEMQIGQADYPRIQLPFASHPADGVPFNPFAGMPFGEAGVWQVISGPAIVQDNKIVPVAPGTVTLSYALPETNNYCGGIAGGPLELTASPAQLPATVHFSGLDATYDGEPKSITVTTEPPGLDVLVRYRGFNSSANLPVDAGSYAFEALVTTPGYSGYATGTLTIGKAVATLSATPYPNYTYTGHIYSPAVTTTPAGLAYKMRVNGYSQNTYHILSIGDNTIQIELFSSNHEPSTVTFTQTVAKGALTIQPAAARHPVGRPFPEFTYSITGAGGAYIPPLAAPTTLATPNSPPGTYTLNPPSLELIHSYLKQRYHITLLPGILELYAPAAVASLSSYETLLLSEQTGIPEAKLTLRLSGSETEPAFTGTLAYRDEAFSVRGRFTAAPDGTAFATAYWRLPYKQKAHAGRDRLALELTRSDTLQARLVAYPELGRVPLSEQTLAHTSEPELPPSFIPPARGSVAFAGRHTFLFLDAAHLDTYGDPRPPLPSVPVGPGHGTAIIDAKGRLSLRGTLGDGQPFTATLAPDSTFSYRLFANPYARPDSLLSGWLPLKEHPVLPGRLHLPLGDTQELYWRKTASLRDPAYRAGFGAQPLTLNATLDPWDFFTDYVSYLAYPAFAGNLVSSSASLTAEPLDINRRTGVFTQKVTLHDNTLAQQLSLPPLATRPAVVKGVLRQPPPGDDLVGAGLILLPVPGRPTSEVHGGRLLLRD